MSDDGTKAETPSYAARLLDRSREWLRELAVLAKLASIGEWGFALFLAAIASAIAYGVLSWVDTPDIIRMPGTLVAFIAATAAGLYDSRDDIRAALEKGPAAANTILDEQQEGRGPPKSERPDIPYAYNRGRNTFLRYADNRHLITFGPTRSGKGTTVIVQTLLLAPHSIICIDPKGQNAAITKRHRATFSDVHLLNPFNEHGFGSGQFNPLAHLRIDQPNIVADVRSLAEALVIGDATREPHWSDSARGLVAALTMHLIAKKGGDATLPEMRRLLTQPEPLFLETIGEMAKSNYPFIAQPSSRFLHGTTEIKNIISNAITQTEFLDDPALIHVLSGSDFTMLDLKQKPTTVYLILPARYLDAYARFFRLIITSAVDQLASQPGGHRTLFILDEFAALKSLDAVSKAFGYAAGYNVQVWPFLQDLPQLKTIYPERWETFIANAGLLQFFTPADMTTAEYLQRRGGRKLDKRKSESIAEISAEQARGGFTGLTESYTDERVPLLPIEEMMNLSESKQIVFFAGVHGASPTQRAPYWTIPRLAGLYDPDPFHSE
jgi:type IV secretion system protein VirD4